jgi:hypothetical protein
MKLLEQLKEFRTLILIVTTIVGVTLGAIGISSKYVERVKKVDLRYLRETIIQWQISYNCYRETCQKTMPPELYKVYMEKVAERDKLEEK